MGKEGWLGNIKDLKRESDENLNVGQMMTSYNNNKYSSKLAIDLQKEKKSECARSVIRKVKEWL